MKQLFISSMAAVSFGLAFSVVAPGARAEDWPQWRGPQRSGISAERGWSHRWPASGPRRLWGVQVGQGFSGVAVVGGRLYTAGNVNGQDVVYCLNADTGQVIWRYAYPCDPGDYGGPRATPTADGASVYTLSRDGRAFCLNALNGRPVWQKDLRREMNAQTPNWGFAGSPLIEGNLVLFNVGTAGIALDKRTGRTEWASGPKTAGYASPVPFTLGAQRGVAFFVAWGIVAVNPASGRPLWQHNWNTNFDVNAADPIVSGDSVFISSNYNRGGALLKVSGKRASVVWENRNMRNHFNTCVLLNGFLYGNDENTLKCIEWSTGRERWRLRGIDKGGLIASDGRLIVLTGRGELVIAQATPERYVELARARVLDGTTWTPPVLANGRIYCRSHEGMLVCLDVRK
jgi:outer membrane protein assembly factor BamB